jgi:dTDP-4-dehydrorhamnose 3,5-epimerase
LIVLDGMKFTETGLEGAWIVDVEPLADDRGFFGRTWCAKEFAEHGMVADIAQCNLSYNHRRGTLRGLHYQVPPAAEAKFVRCTAGAVHDVIVDVRPGSGTYLQWVGVDLTAENRRALYVPPMFAHGYLTLTDGAEVIYQVSEFYTPGAERGARYDDPAFGIDWPVDVEVISEKDAAWAPFEVSSGPAAPAEGR